MQVWWEITLDATRLRRHRYLLFFFSSKISYVYLSFFIYNLRKSATVWEPHHQSPFFLTQINVKSTNVEYLKWKKRKNKRKKPPGKASGQTWMTLGDKSKICEKKTSFISEQAALHEDTKSSEISGLNVYDDELNIACLSVSRAR